MIPKITFEQFSGYEGLRGLWIKDHEGKTLGVGGEYHRIGTPEDVKWYFTIGDTAQFPFKSQEEMQEAVRKFLAE